MLVLGFVLYGSTALLPLFLQTLLGYTAMLSGMVLSPGGIVICICMPLVGFLLRRYEARWLVVFGVAGVLRRAARHVPLHPARRLPHRRLGPRGAELRPGVSVRAHQRAGLHAASRSERTNYATGLFNLARNIGGSSGIAAVTTLLARRAQFHQSVLVSHLTPYDAPYRDALAKSGRGAAVRRGIAARRGPAGPRHDLRHGAQPRRACWPSRMPSGSWASCSWLIIPLMFLMRKTPPLRGPVPVE